MGDTESLGGASGSAKEQNKEQRLRAQLAWERVQSVIQRRKARQASFIRMVEIIDKVPPEGYLAGLVGSFLSSFLLEATNHRRAGAFTGIWLPLGLAAALYAKIIRQLRKR